MTTADHNDVLDGWGSRLAAARNAADLTQAELAAALGVTLSTVQRWEADNTLSYSRTPSLLDQRRLADVLGVNVTDLFPRTEREATLEGLVAEADAYLERVGGGCS